MNLNKVRWAESLLGIIVILLSTYFLYSFDKEYNFQADNGYYTLNATFANVDGVAAGSDIRLSGVKIGVLDSVSLDKDSYMAILKLRINSDYKIPKDSSISISSEGLLGGKYIGINPGIAPKFFEDGDTARNTQSAVSLEVLLSKLIASK